MVLPRATGLSGAFGRTVLRRAGAQARARASRQLGRRTYASGHGEKQSSELPWMIGSVAVTVPAAGWLWTQGPKKGEHGHESHGEAHEESSEDGEKDEGGEEELKEEEEPQEEEPKEEEPKEEEPKEEEPKEEEPKEEEPQEEESKDETKEEESKDEDEEKEDSGDQKRSGDDVKESEKPSPGSPGQINWDSSKNKGPGEGQKGSRATSEKKGEKDEQSNFSGAKHPYLDDPEKSKKGAGPTETAKIHGTVDSRQPAR